MADAQAQVAGLWPKDAASRGPMVRGRGTDTHWAAILAESARVIGKPTQKHVAYLGGINDSALELPAQRAFFWQGTMQQLDRLANLVLQADRARIDRAQERSAAMVRFAARSRFAWINANGHSAAPANRKNTIFPPPNMALCAVDLERVFRAAIGLTVRRLTQEKAPARTGRSPLSTMPQPKNRPTTLAG